jgi:delta24-sterol reductase
LKIIPAKQYVHLQYRPVFSKSELLKVFEQESREINNDFVECLMYTDDQGVVMVGKMTDDVEHRKINRIGRYWKPWFYKHVEGFLRDGPAEEYIPIREYYHRHTKSLFWELAEIIPFGNNPIYRYIYGWMIPPKISLLKLTQTKALRRLYDLHHVVQDMLVPINKLGEALDVFKREFNIYPLWICPMKLFSHPKYRGLVNPVPDEDLYVDIGGYGSPKAPTFVARESLRRVEKYVRDVGGFQALYADTYMTREEFREMFDHRLYDELRKAYDCEGALPEIYDKISKDARRYE